MTHFAGLILAGGKGRRWGGPKAWAELPDGRSFLELCVEILRQAGAAPIVATLPPNTVHPPHEGLVSVSLPEPGLDMFASLKTGLERLVEYPDWRAVAVLPVDHPLVKAETVTALMGVEATSAIPSFKNKHGHPIRMDRGVVEGILNGSLTGPTLREILHLVGAVDVNVEDAGVIINCNTHEALTEALNPPHRKPFKT